MKQADDKPRWFYVDEAGDPAFYKNARKKKIIIGTPGCSKVFCVGFLRTLDPQQIRAQLAEVRIKISNTEEFKKVASLRQSLLAFHAKNDYPAIRDMVFEALTKCDFRAQVVVARKHEDVFQQKHDGCPDKFYDYLVTSLFQTQLHLSTENHIVFATRGNKTRQHSLKRAVQLAADRFRKKYKCTTQTTVSVDTGRPIQEAVLQAADYVLWAVQRAFEREEMRFFEILRDKIELVWDIYDREKQKNGMRCIYDRKKCPFDIKKASPLSLAFHNKRKATA